jgi:endoglucanase
VNISGGEFGSGTPRYGYTYAYPTRADIDYFAASGVEIIRIPFKWERLQPVIYGPLSAVDRAALKAATTYAVQKGLTVVLDMHNYDARNLPTGSALVGSALLSESALADAWVKIADDYRTQPKVWLGLMNEPNKQAPSAWWRTAQQLTADLRGQRIPNKLIVSGNKWSGAHSWTSSGNAAAAENLVDPDNNSALDVHQYLDADSSGTSAVCKAGSAARVDATLAWAATKNARLFFGEIGAIGDPQCAIEYPAMLAKLNSSAAVVGWTAWGGGKCWNDAYMVKLSPVAGATTPHMKMVLAALPVGR